MNETPTDARSKELNALTSRCVKCGFCNATCPTYLATGLELEGPRGRIELIRSMLNHQPVTHKTREHLDHCLTCLACETTCPSGVEYRHIIDGGRQSLEETLPRSLISRIPRFLLTRAMNHPLGLKLGFWIGRRLRFLLPRSLGAYLKPPRQEPSRDEGAPKALRKVIILSGCVQRPLAPGIDDALARILERLGYHSIRVTGSDCCGALGYHLGEVGTARAQATKTLTALEPYFKDPEGPYPFVLMSSSACGLMLRDYESLLRDDPVGASMAARIMPWILDPLELLERHMDELKAHINADSCSGMPLRIHEPCTFQHGLRLRGRLTDFFRAVGYQVSGAPSHQTCCGAGGIQALLNPGLAQTLRTSKRSELGLDQSESATALTSNIGCMLHLDESGDVSHWLEFLSLHLENFQDQGTSA